MQRYKFIRILQRIKQKEDMENKKPIVLNNLEEWDFTDYIDSLIQKRKL